MNLSQTICESEISLLQVSVIFVDNFRRLFIDSSCGTFERKSRYCDSLPEQTFSDYYNLLQQASLTGQESERQIHVQG
ncbi:hypothetical protein FGO68_gene11000 [Halteria grandinella]|uniref:Uncharacterized protein n=1 Tax=Halteria grandinella TaxID=5974 RepID=A0A8J8NIY8_HALGN|nr:hypothetical protein FGO68_gene11000 [Halteria grandinella]